MTSGWEGEIRARALALGFDACGIAAPEGDAAWSQALAAMVDDGAHGDMDWLERRRAERASPRALWPAVRSVVALAMNYGPQAPSRAGGGGASGEGGIAPAAVASRPGPGRGGHAPGAAGPGCGAISLHAQGRDYHHLLKKRLKALARWLAAAAGCQVKVFVDTAPVMEKPLAAKAGIGWQGKHTNLVSRRFGSWLFLGEIYTTLELAPDRPAADRCGSCNACQTACPTAAIPAPYRLDARRCISYLTIEHKGHIGREFRAAMGDRIYGCDDCLAVCPWNKFAVPAREAALQPRADLAAPRLVELAGLDEAAFRALFSGSPIKRIGRDRFLRNVMIALGNGGNADSDGSPPQPAGADRAGPALAAVKARLDDRSPLVRAMAVWALSRLADGREFAAQRARHREGEEDACVRREWDEAEAHP